MSNLDVTLHRRRHSDELEIRLRDHDTGQYFTLNPAGAEALAYELDNAAEEYRREKAP